MSEKPMYAQVEVKELLALDMRIRTLTEALMPFTWPGKDMGDATVDDKTPFTGTVWCGDVMRARKATGGT